MINVLERRADVTMKILKKLFLIFVAIFVLAGIVEAPLLGRFLPLSHMPPKAAHLTSYIIFAILNFIMVVAWFAIRWLLRIRRESKGKEVREIYRTPTKGALLGLFFPGLGFAYGGNIKIFAVYNTLYALISISIGWLVVRNYLHGIYWNFSLNILWYIFSAIGAYWFIKKHDSIKRYNYNKSVLIVLALFVSLMSVTFVMNRNAWFGYDLHRITGQHNILRHGDFVVSENSKRVRAGDIIIYNGSRGISVGTVIFQDQNSINVLHKHDKDPINANDVIGIVKYIWISFDEKGYLSWDRFPGTVYELDTDNYMPEK